MDSKELAMIMALGGGQGGSTGGTDIFEIHDDTTKGEVYDAVHSGKIIIYRVWQNNNRDSRVYYGDGLYNNTLYLISIYSTEYLASDKCISADRYTVSNVTQGNTQLVTSSMSSSSINIPTTDKLATIYRAGMVKPDNSTITVNSNGVISATASGGYSDVFIVTAETLSADLINAFTSGKICIHTRTTSTGNDVFIAFDFDNRTKSIIFSKVNLYPVGKNVYCTYIDVKVSGTTVNIGSYYSVVLITDAVWATTSNRGLVKPDGTTIAVDKYGKINTVIPAPPSDDGQYVLSVVDGVYSWVSST